MAGHRLWIIPARAGFTLVQEGDLLVGRDHPRACGVYSDIEHLWPDYEGSSPRVRGLPDGLGLFSVIDGIIPARAGFT